VVHFDLSSWTVAAAAAVAGIVVGIVLLVRGVSGFVSAGRIRGTSPSRISSIAVGEVLVTGAVEPAEVLLVSPLQSAECVYYRSRISDASEGEGRDAFREERAVGFRVRDASGAVRAFPRGAAFDVPDASTRAPTGMAGRSGSDRGSGRCSRRARTTARRGSHSSSRSTGPPADRPSGRAGSRWRPGPGGAAIARLGSSPATS
jgi:hypothetical protein